MSAPGSILWFAAHETRLAWRDWLWLMTRGQRGRAGRVALGFAVYAAFMHGLAYLTLAPSAKGLAAPDGHVLIVAAGTLVLGFSAMLSQAMESVTRAFYARGDLELILTSPAPSSRLFAVRIAAMVSTTLTTTLVLAAPWINMLAWLGGARWLCAYLVAFALSMLAVAVAVVIVGGLFRAIGARRTRFVSQIVAAVIGAAFAIGLQFAAILSFGTMAVPRFAVLERFAADADSALWQPGRALFGDLTALAGLLGLGALALGAVIYVFAPRFGALALAAGSASPVAKRQARKPSQFRSASPAQALRQKEWTLLLRDPWLISQTLMQLLYLAPAAFLMWRNYFSEGGAATLLAPVLIMSAGQLGGGLAWLAVSGEDAPELIATAPVATKNVLRAKTEAVLGGVGAVFLPFILALAFVAPFAALVSLAGVAVAAGSATAIQYWFRGQAKRSLFRRRQVASKVATIAEALSSTCSAGAGALAAAGTWLSIVPGAIVIAVLAGAWLMSPARESSKV